MTQSHRPGDQEPDIPAANADCAAMLATAHKAADLARAAILPHFRQPIQVENKASNADFDPVTAADQAAEHAIRNEIETRWPEHGLIGEEYGETRTHARYRWVIDPIDGTRSFIIGSPLWGTLIGVLDGDTPVLGVMDQPFTQERFFTDAASTYWRGGAGDTRTLSTRTCSTLKDAVITTTHPIHFDDKTDLTKFYKLAEQTRMSRYGGDCYSYALLAAGHLDLVVETGLKPYDIVAMIPIIERAGGIVTTWDGKPATNGGRIIAAGDRSLHEQAITVLTS